MSEAMHYREAPGPVPPKVIPDAYGRRTVVSAGFALLLGLVLWAISTWRGRGVSLECSRAAGACVVREHVGPVGRSTVIPLGEVRTLQAVSERRGRGASTYWVLVLKTARGDFEVTRMGPRRMGLEYAASQLRPMLEGGASTELRVDVDARPDMAVQTFAVAVLLFMLIVAAAMLQFRDVALFESERRLEVRARTALTFWRPTRVVDLDVATVEQIEVVTTRGARAVRFGVAIVIQGGRRELVWRWGGRAAAERGAARLRAALAALQN